MRSENEEVKAAYLFAYLCGKAPACIFAKSIVGWPITEESRVFSAVCKWLVQQCPKEVDPVELIRRAMDADLDINDLIKSLSHMDGMHDKAGFND